jgi:hypothetical protein
MPRRSTVQIRDPRILALAGEQAGCVSRTQLVDVGLSDDQLRQAVASGRWADTGFPGVYLASPGLDDYPTRCWAALLYAGAGAVLSHATASWWWRLRDEAPDDVHVTVPVSRRVRPQAGLRVHYALHLEETRHPGLIPPRTRIEDTVLDLADAPRSRAVDVIDLVLRACQRRLTTSARLAERLEMRLKIRHRKLLTDVLAEAAEGVQSALERRYARDVERAHGLPRGRRSRQEGRPGGRRYRDVRYDRWSTVVELDGATYHPEELREQDQLRDNDVLVEDGARTVRYGWRTVTVTPCTAAAQVLTLVVQGGWTGTPRRCGPSCTLQVPC